MPSKGKRKYRCFECETEQMVHWVQRERRARLRCSACGSLAMDPVSRGAKEEIEDEGETRGHAPTTSATPGGSPPRGQKWRLGRK